MNTPRIRKDTQKNRVYRWENIHVGSLDRSQVAFKDIQPIVDYIWSELGLEYAPRVRPMPTQKGALGDATRLTVRFQENRPTPTWVIIHELAHSLTSDLELGSAQHGPDFVGVYMHLLSKFIPGANLVMLMTTAKMMKVDFNIMARWAVLD